MAILKVAQIGHPILRRVADPIPVEAIGTPPVQQLIQDLRDTLEEYDGAGLAAPQVHASVRLVITEIDDEPVVLINPVITPIGDEYCRTYEGCLSIRNMRAAVERPAVIRLQAYAEDGSEIDRVLEDFNAVVTQHECDHLDGILYVDRADPRTLAFLEEYRRWGPLDDYLYGEGEE